MRKPTKILVALAFGGLTVVGGSTALTGTGLTNNAGATQFIGGTVSQAVTGATLSAVNYSFADSTNNAIDEVLLTFASDADGKQVSINFTTTGTAAVFTCTDVEAVTHTSTCTPVAANQLGADGINVTVAA
ncbi:MAG: hypothetical protein QOF52_1337 [Propionibacteriaceae bacterium]|jgi:hypothetical protein|nr:hypothetical protein [Propionibacteriaceae bacterium]